MRYIAFDSNGGSSVSMISPGIGSAIKASETPEKQSCTFGGWHTDPYCTDEYSIPANMPNFDPDAGVNGVTVYAK